MTPARRAAALHDDGRRTAPKVPGINAEALRPSIGTDNWRTSPKGKRIRNNQLRKAVPVGNRGSEALTSGKGRLPKASRKRLRQVCQAHGIAFLRNADGTITVNGPEGTITL